MAQSDHTRLVAAIAVVGGFLLLLGTTLHPMGADPNDLAAAFTEYAADASWQASHITQLAGVAIIVAALVLLSEIMAAGPARLWAVLGSSGAVASLAVAAALQAVDGVALKVMVDRWAEAIGPDKLMKFEAAVGVRQVEAGLASMMSLLFGATFVLYGIAVLTQPHFRSRLAWLGVIGGAGLLANGTVMAYTGFSSLAMNIGMASTATLLLWLADLAIALWRSSTTTPPKTGI